MIEKLFSLIPKMVYSSGEEGIGEDAFDVAIDGVLRRFHLDKVMTKKKLIMKVHETQ